MGDVSISACTASGAEASRPVVWLEEIAGEWVGAFDWRMNENGVEGV